MGKNLDMDKTLEENGVKDEADDLYDLSLNEHEWIPEIQVYFNDDLTEL